MQDRSVQYPYRRKVTNESTGIVTYEKIERAQGSIYAEGTPLNANTLLSSTAINALGLTQSDPVPSDAFIKLNDGVTTISQKADNNASNIQILSNKVSGANGLETKVSSLESDVTTINGTVSTIENDITELKYFVGYPDSGVLGLIADFENYVFTRYGEAVGKTQGADFDGYRMYQRRRCNLADDGTVNAYYGDAGYIEDGSNGQVMVEQNKFYYKVVPLKLEKQLDGEGYHLRKALYMVTDNYVEGFKCHPRFVLPDGSEIDKVYLSAYEGCIWDASTQSYILDDAQVAEFTTDKLSSIANAKPCSGLTQQLTRPNVQLLAINRGSGWMSDDIKTESMNELLMIIELGVFNTQSAIGLGVVSFPTGEGNESVNTGQTSALGNTTGQAPGVSGQVSVTYRGYENPWGNIGKLTYGLNIFGNGSQKGGIPYYCTDFNYQESTHSGNYVSAGFTLSNTLGYVSAFGYSENCDWMFLPSETLGSSVFPVGDFCYVTPNLNAYRVSFLGGDWADGSYDGGFYWNLNNEVGNQNRNISSQTLNAF